MPIRNVNKIDVDNGYYHVYARGHNKMRIFVDDEDYRVFIGLFKRYLSKQVAHNYEGEPYPHLYQKLELLCFCLMPNHFHLLIYQKEAGSMTLFMRGLMGSYSRYFNNKYSRTGSLFESRYKASMILNPAYLEHISRYIHLNPKAWKNYDYSSLKFYFDKNEPEWLRPKKIKDMFDGREDYMDFLSDYEDTKQMLKEIQHELANDITS